MSTSAGRVAPVPKGAYNSSVTYQFLDIVSSAGASYLVKQTVTGVAPPNSTYYMLLASSGLCYGTSSTAGATAAKVVTTVRGDFDLTTGNGVLAKFSYPDTAGAVTLNVDGTGAKSVYLNGSPIAANKISADQIYEFVYDGTNFELVSGVVSGSSGGGGAYYGLSTTGGSTAAKAVVTTSGDFELETGADIIIKFSNDDTAGSITLSIDGSTAKSVTLNGSAIGANIIKSNTVYEFVYNGTAFELLSGASSGGGGHTILNSSGQPVTQRSNLQFGQSEVTDDAVGDKTIINVNNAIPISYADYQALTQAEKENGNVYYITDYPSIGGAYFFQTVSAMEAAISGGTVPNNTICVVEEDTPYVVDASDVTYSEGTVEDALDGLTQEVTIQMSSGQSLNSKSSICIGKGVIGVFNFLITATKGNETNIGTISKHPDISGGNYIGFFGANTGNGNVVQFRIYANGALKCVPLVADLSGSGVSVILCYKAQ